MNTLKRVILIVISWSLIGVIVYAGQEKPVPVFSFNKASYEQGEDITVKEASYSKSGLKIVQKEWMTHIKGKKRTSRKLSTVLIGVKPGKLEVFLRVKDEKGVWSDWTSRQTVINAAQPIEVIDFKSEKSTYAIGEKLEFTYSYKNPQNVVPRSQRWGYKNTTTGGSFVFGKPKYFKKPGIYEVMLQVQDEWGNWSERALCKVTVGHEKIERNGYYLFNKGKQGDLIDGYIDKDYNTFDLLQDVQIQDVPGTLIVSNSPESISSSGILYKDTSIGKGRLVVHHLNNTSISKKLMITASTSGEKPVQLTIRNEAIKGPHKNILKTGQAATRDYFKGKSEMTYTVKPGALTCIYESSDIKEWGYKEVISGMLDFESDGPVTWHIVSMDFNSPIDNISKLNVLEKDAHIRGTFPVIERNYSIHINELKAPGKIVIGSQSQEWLVGEDALTGETVTNRGSYGLPTQIELISQEDMGIVLNARGGGYLGAIKWKEGKVFDVPNEEILNNKKLAALIGRANANEVTRWTYMLPNGSSAPILFGFVPEHLWSE